MQSAENVKETELHPLLILSHAQPVMELDSFTNHVVFSACQAPAPIATVLER
jgi:hypothetical protein